MSDPKRPPPKKLVKRSPPGTVSAPSDSNWPKKASPSLFSRTLRARDAFGLRVVGPIIFVGALLLAGLLIVYGLRVWPFHDAPVVHTPTTSQAIDVTIPDDVGQSARSTTTPSKDPPPPVTPSKDPPPPIAPREGGKPSAPASGEPPPHKLVTVEVPGAVFDRLGPQPDTGPTAPQVAAAAVGVSIIVALLALFGVLRTVRGKWVDDQLADIWERFQWIIDQPRYEFFNPLDRGTILAGLAKRAELFKDGDLRRVIDHFQLEVLDRLAKQRGDDPQAIPAEQMDEYLKLLLSSRAVPPVIAHRAAHLQDGRISGAAQQEYSGPATATSPSAPGAGDGGARSRVAVSPTAGPARPTSLPTSKDAVEQLCDDFTRQLQDAVTQGPKAAGLHSDYLDSETMDAINAVAAQHPHAAPESITNALGEFQLQLDGTHYKEREAVWRAAKAGEIASTVTTMELTETTTAARAVAVPRTVEIVLPDYAAARAWVMRHRRYPFLSRIYVETVFNTP